MFNSVRIQNFRQFKDLKLDGLAQINLITGKNNTGKTSLLEALFLLDGPSDPARTIPIAQFRGIGGLKAESPELWDWLFHNRDTSRPILMIADGASGQRTMLAIRLSGASTIRTGLDDTPQGGRSLVTAEAFPSLVYDVRVGDGDTRLVELSWTSDGLRLDPDLPERRRQGFFLPDFHRPGHAEAVRLSYLEARGRGEAALDALGVIEPRLKQLRVLDFGDGARVYADIGQRELVPLTAMGQGFGKLLTIVAAIILEEDSIYLIDEFDAGFHYSTLPDVWKVIVKSAIDHSAQVFATTHSYECLEAAVQGSRGYEGKLAMFRLERDADRVRAVDVDDEGLRDAISLGFEMR